MDTYITGNTIKSIREKRGLTQLKIAEMLNVSDKAVYWRWNNRFESF